MTVLTLKILGGFEARRSSGGIAEIPIRKGQALLAYLALNPGQVVARSKLAGLLWGDRGDMQARTSLRQTLTVLRRALKPIQDQVLRADRQSIGLVGAAIDVDAVSFQELIARGTPADLETAVSLYRGELLDGLDLSDPGFQAWLEDERRRFHDLMAAALNALMAHRRGAGAGREAIVLGQRLLTLDPLREDVHRALMVLYAELGQRHTAQKQYRRCRDLLASELDVEPEAETEALYQTLLDGGMAGAGPIEARGAIVLDRQETGGGVANSPDEGSRRPAAVMAGVLQGSRRRVVAAGRVLIIGGVAALSWLLAWGYQAVQPLPDLQDSMKIDALSSNDLAGVDGVPGLPGPAPPDRRAPARPGGSSLAAAAFGDLSGVLDGVFKSSGPAGLYRRASSFGAEPSLVVASIDRLSGVLEDVSKSSGPAWPDRTAPARPLEPSLAVASFDHLSGVLARATDYASPIVPAEAGAGDAENRGAHDARLAMQGEADGLWSELADSWDIGAFRAFRTRFPEARQVSEAERRIAFLIENHREAQAGLNRLGYEAGPVDGIWGLRSARAMRAFQSDSGLAPDGVVSEALLDRLKAATPEVAEATAAAPETRPISPAPEAVAASRSAQDRIPEGSRWTAFGKSRNGSKIMAAATRRGESLKLVFELDHRESRVIRNAVARYTDSCIVVFSGLEIECWIGSNKNLTPGGKIFGTFPKLTFQMLFIGHYGTPMPDEDIVLDFRPELETATPEIAARIIPMQEPEPQPVRREPEAAVVSLSLQGDIPEGGRWTASGRSLGGSNVVATATRRGDTLELVFDLDHRGSSLLRNAIERYTDTCAVIISKLEIDCWISANNKLRPGAKIFGTFPKLTLQMLFVGNYGSTSPDEDVVLDFRPELKTATPEIAAPGIPTPEPQPQAVRREPEVVMAPASARQTIREGRRWTASGTSRGGSEIIATAIRRGDSLVVAFDVDHRHSGMYPHRNYLRRYTQNCAGPAGHPVFDCWISSRPYSTYGARVVGTFPQLRFSFQRPPIDHSDSVYTLGDIVLEFRPELRLAAE